MSRPTQAEYLRHELFDRANIAQEMMSSLFEGHLALKKKSKAFTPVELAVLHAHIQIAEETLAGLYQFIGEIHLK